MNRDMIKYDLLLCSSIFYDYYIKAQYGFQTDDEVISMTQVLRNHKIVLSDNILRIYKLYAKEHDKMGTFSFFRDWYAEQAYVASANDKFVHLFDHMLDTNDIDTVFSATAKDRQLSNPMVICDVCQKCFKFANAIKPTTVVISTNALEENIENELRRNMIPFSVETKKDESIEPYVHWFSEMLDGQKSIIIFNRYAYKTAEFESMIGYVVERASDNAEILIYLDNRESGIPQDDIVTRNSRLKSIAANKHLLIKVFDYDHNNLQNRSSYHNRRVFLKKDYIKFDAGFDSLPPIKDGGIIKKGNLEISHQACDVNEKVGSILSQHPGYIDFWDSNKASDDFVVTW